MIKEGSFSEIILESLESFSRKKAPEQNLREIKIGQYVEYENATDFELSLLDRIESLEERVKMIEEHTESHKESFNDFN
jgi:hypothetical protein